jgi:hypothetical protein
MNDILNFFANNYHWIFSGIGVAVISTLIWLFRRKRILSNRQFQKSGSHSFIVQVGGDVKIVSNKRQNED